MAWQSGAGDRLKCWHRCEHNKSTGQCWHDCDRIGSTCRSNWSVCRISDLYTVFQPICTAIFLSSMRCVATTTNIFGFTDFVVSPFAIHTLTSIHSLTSNERSPLQTIFNQALKPEVSNGSGGQIVARKCDVTDEAQLLLTFKWIKSEYGRLDVFVNNAGVIKSDMVLGMQANCYRFSASFLITKIHFVGRWAVFRWTFGWFQECVRCQCYCGLCLHSWSCQIDARKQFIRTHHCIEQVWNPSSHHEEKASTFFLKSWHFSRAIRTHRLARVNNTNNNDKK